MPGYSTIKLSDALTALSQRLYDPTNQFWSQAELTLYIIEAQRTFNALANYWKAEFTFQTTPNQWWYDLTAQTNSLRPFTVTDIDLYTIMEYHLLEPAVGAGPWTGSLQFSISDLVQAVERRQNETLSVSGCTLSRATVAALPGRTYLPDKTIDTRRVAWLPQSGFGYNAAPLWSGDSFEAQSYDPTFPQQPGGQPSIYMRSTEPPFSFDTDIPPACPGNYDVLTVDATPGLTADSPTTLVIPDDWTWLVKWAALADLLGRESNAKDPLRAKYCEHRYQHAVMLLKDAPSVLVGRVGNVPVQIDAVQSADDYAPDWQAQAAASPTGLLVAGLNLAAVYPKPDAGPYSVTVSVVQNAPVTSDTTVYLQVSREDYDAIIDYAQHLAAFKMGGQEFMNTLPLFDRLLKQAALYNAKLLEMGEFSKTLLETGGLQEERSPRLAPEGAE